MTIQKFYSERKSYTAGLTSQEWRAKRAEILDRDGRRCRNCGEITGLEVHHRQYHVNKRTGRWQRPYAYSNKYLITLCGKCHKNGHEQYQIPIFYTNH